MNNTILKLTEDEFKEFYRGLCAWKERDAARTVKYQRLIGIPNRKRKIRQTAILMLDVAAIALVLARIPWTGGTSSINPDSLYSQFYEPYRFAPDY